MVGARPPLLVPGFRFQPIDQACRDAAGARMQVPRRIERRQSDFKKVTNPCPPAAELSGETQVREWGPGIYGHSALCDPKHICALLVRKKRIGSEAHEDRPNVWGKWHRSTLSFVVQCFG